MHLLVWQTCIYLMSSIARCRELSVGAFSTLVLSSLASRPHLGIVGAALADSTTRNELRRRGDESDPVWPPGFPLTFSPPTVQPPIAGSTAAPDVRDVASTSASVSTSAAAAAGGPPPSASYAPNGETCPWLSHWTGTFCDRFDTRGYHLTCQHLGLDMWPLFKVRPISVHGRCPEDHWCKVFATPRVKRPKLSTLASDRAREDSGERYLYGGRDKIVRCLPFRRKHWKDKDRRGGWPRKRPREDDEDEDEAAPGQELPGSAMHTFGAAGSRFHAWRSDQRTRPP